MVSVTNGVGLHAVGGALGEALGGALRGRPEKDRMLILAGQQLRTWGQRDGLSNLDILLPSAWWLLFSPGSFLGASTPTPARDSGMGALRRKPQQHPRAFHLH